MSHTKPVIMVVDDNPEWLQTIKRVLRIIPEFDIVMYSDPFKALTSAVRVDPSVILMDMMLYRFDGIKVLREIRKQGVTAPAIILTAYDGAVITKRICPENNIRAVIDKTNMVSTLVDAVVDAYQSSSKGVYA